MSLIIGNGMCITYTETAITCPICEQAFDASKKIDAAKYPVFNTKCPKCKGKITISVPIFGGFTKCWETNCPPRVERIETVTPNHVNGVAYWPDQERRNEISRLINGSKHDEDDKDEDDDDPDADNPVTTKPPKRSKP